MPGTDPRAVNAAARAHYAYVWRNVNGDPEDAKARWDRGQVDADVLAYHREHVRHQVEAAAPYLYAQAVRDEAGRWLSLEGHEVYTSEDVGNVLEHRADDIDPR